MAAHTLHGHTGAVNALVCTEKYLISASYDTTIRVWDIDSFQLRATLHGHKGGVYALCMVQGYLASGSVDKTIRLWDLQSMTCSATLEGHTQSVHSLTLWNDTLTSGGIDNSVMMWDMSGSTRQFECDKQSGLYDTERNDQRENLWGVFSLCSINGLLCSGHRNGAVCVWNIESGECVKVLNSSYATRDRSEDGRHLRLSAMCKLGYELGEFLVTACWDQTICVWDPQTWHCVQKLETHEHNIDSLCEVNGKLASGDKEGCIFIWAGVNLKMTQMMQGPKDGIRSLCQVNGRLASGSHGVVQIWNLDDDEAAGAGSGGREMDKIKSGRS